MLLQVDKGDVGGTCVNSLQNESHSHTCHGRTNNYSSILRHESEACKQEDTIADEASSGEPFLKASGFVTVIG